MGAYEREKNTKQEIEIMMAADDHLEVYRRGDYVELVFDEQISYKILPKAARKLAWILLEVADEV